MKSIPMFAFCALSLILNSAAFASDKPLPNQGQQPAVEKAKEKPGQDQHASAGFYPMVIGERFLALLPENPTLETKAYLEKHIAAPGISWEVTDCRNLGGADKHYGLSLKSSAGASALSPSFIHVSGIPKDIDVKSEVHFEFASDGSLVAKIGDSKYPVIKKAEMIASMILPGANGITKPGLALTTKTNK